MKEREEEREGERKGKEKDREGERKRKGERSFGRDVFMGLKRSIRDRSLSSCS